ncbi:MAG TPA: DUF1684 domain-containing protein [Usitatibacter sp.]|jgi:hypothetical protein|nr:DUF1684 domain-containing protein [Usitatibacter sp.]
MKSLKILAAAAALAALPALSQGVSVDPAYVKQVKDWRTKAEEGLRRDNGWLTLAGRYPLKPGENTFGTAKTNDIVFPPGLGPNGMGSVWVEPGKVKVKLVEGFRMKAWDGEFSEREMQVGEKPEWVSAGRAAFQIIERNGRYILRLADNQSEVRKTFGGRVWYDVDDNYRVDAKFVPYDTPKKIQIVNVLDEVSDEAVSGYIQFEVFGRPYRFDAMDDEGGLFIIFKDRTAGETTYGSGRFLYVAEKPKPNTVFKLDLNRAYNPPCAFSEYTTCPLPPKQNILNTRIEAGEKYPPLKKG